MFERVCCGPIRLRVTTAILSKHGDPMMTALRVGSSHQNFICHQISICHPSSAAAAACVLLRFVRCYQTLSHATEMAGPEGNPLPRIDPERRAAEGSGREGVIALFRFEFATELVGRLRRSCPR